MGEKRADDTPETEAVGSDSVTTVEYSSDTSQGQDR